MLHAQRYSKQSIIKRLNLLVAVTILVTALQTHEQIISKSDFVTLTSADVKVGAERMEQYIDMLKGKNVAIVANQTSLVKNTLLVDTLMSLGIKVTKIFAPEHGFYGTADAGATIKNGKDK